MRDGDLYFFAFAHLEFSNVGAEAPGREEKVKERTARGNLEEDTRVRHEATTPRPTTLQCSNFP